MVEMKSLMFEDSKSGSCHLAHFGHFEKISHFCKKWLNFIKSVLVEMGRSFYHQKMRNIQLSIETFKLQMKKDN